LLHSHTWHVCITHFITHYKNGKKKQKAKQPLYLRIIKVIAITLCCAILLAAIAKRLVHLYGHIAK
jgi:hypothetical protein